MYKLCGRRVRNRQSRLQNNCSKEVCIFLHKNIQRLHHAENSCFHLRRPPAHPVSQVSILFIRPRETASDFPSLCGHQARDRDHSYCSIHHLTMFSVWSNNIIHTYEGMQNTIGFEHGEACARIRVARFLFANLFLNDRGSLTQYRCNNAIGVDYIVRNMLYGRGGRLYALMFQSTRATRPSDDPSFLVFMSVQAFLFSRRPPSWA